MTTRLTGLSAAKMAQMVHGKQVSPAELVSAHVRRSEELQPRLNAFVTIDAERALQQAAQAEATLTRDTELPPLLDVPIRIKSSIDVAGLRCEAGSPLRAMARTIADLQLMLRVMSGADSGDPMAADFLPSYAIAAGFASCESAWLTKRSVQLLPKRAPPCNLPPPRCRARACRWNGFSPRDSRKPESCGEPCSARSEPCWYGTSSARKPRI